MSDDNSPSSDNDDAMSNFDSGAGINDEYEAEPRWPLKKELAQRNINEYSELAQSYSMLMKGYRKGGQKPPSYRNFVKIYRTSTYIDYSVSTVEKRCYSQDGHGD